MFIAAAALALCFGQPQPVAIEGYADHAMEPFIARDGQTLFFNNRNDPPRETDLHWASRVDATHFRYRGRIASANSNHLDGVPSLARETGPSLSPRCALSRAEAPRSGWAAGATTPLPRLTSKPL